MGLLDKFKARAEERQQAAMIAERAREDAAAEERKERELDPVERIKQPEWANALVAAGIDPSTVVGVVNGCSGTINTAGVSSLPDQRRVGIGVVVLTNAGKLAYALRSGGGVEVVVRRNAEIEQMRKSNMGGTVWVVFEGDRCFPDRGGVLHLADNWELPAANHQPDAVRKVFLAAGYSV